MMKFSVIYLTILCALLGVCGCNKNTMETLDDPLVGTYYLDYENCISDYMDFDGDCIHNANILVEFRHMIGYWEPYHVATVSKSITDIHEGFGETSYTINVRIPYPNYTVVNGLYAVDGMGYLKQSLRFNTNSCVTSNDVTVSNSSSDNLFLSGIKQIKVKRLNENEVDIKIVCLMYNLIKQCECLSEIELHYVRDREFVD